jgi:flagellar biogenesis protein FliO
MKTALPLLATIVVLIAAYYVVYRYNAKAQVSRMIRVKERFALSKDKMLCVAEFNGKTYFIALTNGGIELLEKVDSTEIIPADSDAGSRPSFGESFRTVWEKRKGGGE